MKIIVGISWFTDSCNTTGIILTYDETRQGDKYRAFIGCIFNPQTQTHDMNWISEHGAKFPEDIAKQIIFKQGQIFHKSLFESAPSLDLL